jgi:CRP-like cAMP-binding protein
MENDTMDYISFYRDILGITDKNVLKTASARSGKIEVRKKEVFLHIGDFSDSICFLERGLIRGYYLNHRGKKITDCFIFEPGTPLAASFGLESPAALCLEALETSRLVSLPLDCLMELQKESIEVLKLYNLFLRRSLRKHWECKLMLTQYGAKERYSWFLNEYPELEGRVNLKDIASFLGITAVSLSRIRKELRG